MSGNRMTRRPRGKKGPAGGSGGWPLARTGTSLGAGVVALTLIVGGYLLYRHFKLKK